MTFEASAIGLEAVLRVKAREAHSGDEDESRQGWLRDPTGWILQRLREPIWSKQREIAESIRDHRRTAVKASYDVGKSFLAARICAWWLSTHNPGEAFVVTTAASFAQVRAILWREINRAYVRGSLPGRVNQTEWWLGSEMVAIGRKPADYDAEAFAGIHARYVLTIIDEASGVPAALWDAAEGLLANEESRILAIGNPIDAASRFAMVCKPDSGWNTIRISAFESPNFTGETQPDGTPYPEGMLAQLVSKVWVEERRKDWGETSPLWVARVLGEFPEESTDAVVLLSWVNACRLDPDDPVTWTATEPNELGVDVGAGGDESVIAHRKGAMARIIWHGQTPDSPQVSGQVVDALRETGATSVKIDVIGIGWGVVGRLQELREQGVISAEIYGVNVADAPRDPAKFGKLRDEIWWDVGRENSRMLAWDLRALEDSTVGQLIAPKYGLDSAGRIKVEPKEETKKRLGRSPDHADALLLAFYQPLQVVDTDWMYNIWTCRNPRCGWKFTFSPYRPCPQCATRAPETYPKPPGVL